MPRSPLVSASTRSNADTFPSGVDGFDEIAGSGLRRGCVTLLTGGPGCGKTIFAMQSAVASACRGEPALFVAFEESADRVLKNASVFDWGVRRVLGKTFALVDANLSSAVVHGGEFDLVGLLAMLGVRAKQLKAKLIVLDGMDVLLSLLGEPALVRREVFRIRDWLGELGVTSLITAKRRTSLEADDPYDFLPFMSESVVMFHHRVIGGTAFRFVRIAKQRGAAHSANEFPFTVSPTGIAVAAGARTELEYPASRERISSGVARLDAMMEGGYLRGSAVLLSGAPGTAKTTLALAFAGAACRRKERTLYLSFDEAPQPMLRNIESVGMQIAPHVKSGRLRLLGLSTWTGAPAAHIARIRALVREFKPRNVIIDPLSAFAQSKAEAVGERAAVEVLEYAKSLGLTILVTSLVGNLSAAPEQTRIGISTIADTWIHLTYFSQAGERNRGLTIVKSRGTSHSNQVRELLLSKRGIDLADVFSINGEVLMGTLRWQRESVGRRAREQELRRAQHQEHAAELAVAEALARVEAVTRERAIREAELERVRAERSTEVRRATREADELLRLRHSDTTSISDRDE